MLSIRFIVFAFLTISCKLVATNKDSLILIINTTKNFSEKIKAINTLSEIAWLQANYDTSITLINQAFELEKKELVITPNNNTILKEQAITFNNLAIVCRFKGNYTKSLDNHLKALKIRESINDKWGMARSYLGIGTIYEFTNKPDVALDYKFKALKLFKEVNDSAFIGFTLGHIAYIYFGNNKIEKAQQYNYESLMLFIKIGNITGMMDAFTLSGEIYTKQKNYNDAIENFKSALSVNQALGLKDRAISVYVNIANLYYKQSLLLLSRQYLDTALSFSKITGGKNHLSDVYILYYKIDSTTNNYKSALKNYQTYILYRDSLNNQTTSENITKLQNNFETEKIERQRELQNLRIELEHKNQLKQKQTVIYAGLFVLLLLLSVVFLVYKNNLHRKKVNNELNLKNQTIAKQKKEVDEKQKEILDSINYAKRIQEAHLPTNFYINKIINKSAQ